MLTDLSWQLQLLVLEALASLCVGLVAIQQGHYKPGRLWSLCWGLGDLTCIALMLWGGSVSLLHVLYILLYGLGSYGNFRRFAGKRKPVEFKPEHRWGASIFTGFLSLFTIALIAAG